MWSILTTAEVEDDDGTPTSLTASELDQFFLILTIAGSETTRSAISGGLVALLERPEQQQRLASDPGVLNTAVEEILRWVTPVACFARTATTDVEVDGQQIRAGDRVSMWFPAANRDPPRSSGPTSSTSRATRTRTSRSAAAARDFCLGAHLARSEIRTMFTELLTRFPDVEIVGDPTYQVAAPEQTVAVTMRDLPVRLSP